MSSCDSILKGFVPTRSITKHFLLAATIPTPAGFIVRAVLSDWERMRWASPAAVYKHCPVFQYQAERDGEKKAKIPKPSSAERVKELEVENAHLQEELSATNARYDASKPKPGKVKGLMAFYNASRRCVPASTPDSVRDHRESCSRFRG
jgi:hypothetical protein